jgi:RHS repeat-associated protein
MQTMLSAMLRDVQQDAPPATWTTACRSASRPCLAQRRRTLRAYSVVCSPEKEQHARIAIHHYHCDHLGTPLALTDRDGCVVWAVKLDAWGNVQQEYNPQGIHQAIRLPGQHHDRETGLYYNRHRYYDPVVGSYINQDPIGLKGGWNLFLYTTDPSRKIDPLGLEAHENPFKNTYNQKDGYYHYYMTITDLCKKDSCLTCTKENAWEALKKNPAPGWDNSKSVSNLDKTNINFKGLSGGTVSHMVYNTDMTLYNVTREDHIFSNGYVQRSIVTNEDMIQVKSIGEGITAEGGWSLIPRSIRATLNMKLYRPGFEQLDSKIKAEVCKQ